MDAPRQLLRPEPGPHTLKETRWGGTRLARLRGSDPSAQAENIGESWEFSTLAGRESRALGRPLSRVLGGPLPFLAKLIDTARPLSIQLHPDDDPVANTPGKEEAWIILDAEPGAAVLAGLAPGVTRQTFARAVSRANAAPEACGPELLACLNKIPARAGMVILIPARTVHAIGGGILLAEIQQPSDCTYRLHDYGSGRPLHVEQGLATIDPSARARVFDPLDPTAPSSIDGKHLRLRVCGAGRHELDVSRAQPQLLVAHTSPCQVRARAGEAPTALVAGDLALALTGRLTLEVPEGGQAVIGHLARAS